MFVSITDVNECLKKDACPDEQSCINTDGSFECMWNPCPEPGFVRATNGTCLGMLTPSQHQ